MRIFVRLAAGSFFALSALASASRAANPPSPCDVQSLVRLAHQGTASHIEEIVRCYRKVQRLAEAAEAAKVQRSREVRYRWDEDGTFVLTARRPPEQGAAQRDHGATFR